LKAWVRFLFAFHSNNNHFGDKARYWSKIVIFSYPPCIRRPRYGSSRRNIATPFGTEKLEWLGYPTVKQFEDMTTRFDRMYERDRQTDRHMDIAHDGKNSAKRAENDVG